MKKILLFSTAIFFFVAAMTAYVSKSQQIGGTFLSLSEAEELAFTEDLPPVEMVCNQPPYGQCHVSESIYCPDYPSYSGYKCVISGKMADHCYMLHERPCIDPPIQ